MKINSLGYRRKKQFKIDVPPKKLKDFTRKNRMKPQRRKSLGVVGRDNKNIKGIVLQSSRIEMHMNIIDSFIKKSKKNNIR